MNASHLDFTLARVTDATVTAVEGGHELAATLYVPRRQGERILHDVAVAEVRESYAGWEPEAYQAANLRLRRAARDRLAEMATAYWREHD